MRGSGIALLILGMACLTLGVARYRRRAKGGSALLILAPTTILVGGYLTSGAALAATRQLSPLAPSAIDGSRVSTGGAETFSSRDRLIYSLNGRIWSIAPAGGDPINLTPDLENGTFATSPALSPDGRTLAFVQSALPRGGQAAPTATGLVTELYLVDIGGTTHRRILPPPRPEATLADPVWAEGGRALIFTVSLPAFGADGRTVGATTSVERLDMASGQHTTLAADGAEPGVSPSGASDLYAYAATDRDGTLPRLLLSTGDGRNKQQVIGTDMGFQAFHRPRFSPDGRFLIFAAVGGPQDPSGEGSAPDTRLILRRLVDCFAPRSASAHGQPQDLWIVRTDGTGLQRLTRLNADEPSPAWSPDGRQIAFLAGDGLYLMDRSGQGLVQISTQGGNSALVWATP
jgi:Tol biopolymer transport system component